METEPSPAVSFSIAFLAPAAITVAMALSWPLFESNPVTILLLAVVVSSWCGGLWPGLVSLAVSLLASSYFVIEPYFDFGAPDHPNAFQILVALVVGSFLSVVCESLRNQRSRAESEAAAKSVGERLNAMVNTIPQLAWTANADGKIYGTTIGGKSSPERRRDRWKAGDGRASTIPTFCPRLRRGWKRAIATSIPWEMEFVLGGH